MSEIGITKAGLWFPKAIRRRNIPSAKKANVLNARPRARRSASENERVKGIEPSCAAWEAAVLPLNYTRR
jgi:hypothetical protein